MKLIKGLVAAFAGVVLMGAVSGNVAAQNPQSVVQALQSAGYQAKLTKDDSGDPLIESAANGSKFAVFFFGCTNNRDCRTIQFFAGYSDVKPTLQRMNEWNATKRFGRAYVSDAGAARIEMDLDLDDGGLSGALFEDNLEFWVLIMSEFEKHIG